MTVAGGQPAATKALENQVIEVLGLNRLTDELLRAGLEVARPVRDRGLDMIAYADIDSKVEAFVARPIQLKASAARLFGLDQKYSRFPNLLIAYVWNLASEERTVTFALSYAEAYAVAAQMGWTETASWRDGAYVSTNPSSKLTTLLAPYKMTPERWWARVVRGE